MAAKYPTPLPPPLLLRPAILLLLLLCLLLLFPIPSNGEYICPMAPISSSCGNLINISYPFWLTYDSDPSSYCGYPAFMLLCENGTPSLRLGSDNYTVTDIDYEKHTIKLADADIFLGSSDCPRVRHNLTFLTNLTTIPNFPYNNNLTSYFNLTVDYTPSDANIAFFFNCTNGPSLPANEIECLNHLDKKSYAFNFTYGPGPPQEMHDYDLYRNCSDFVVAPVLLEYLDHLFTESAIGKYGDVLKSGFEMRWNELTHGRCSDCESSHGRCGLNQTSNSTSVFACFCSDGKTELYNCTGNVTHSSGAQKKTKLIIGIAVGCGSAVLILLFLCAILLYKLKKKQQYSSSSKSFFSYVSSNTSSKVLEKCSAHFQTHLFSYEELREATNNFDTSKELGDGGFGTVYKGKLRDGRIVAVKRLYENNYRRVEQFRNEIDILSRLRHQNLVDLYGCTYGQGKELLLVYEFIANGTVADHLHGSRASEGKLTWPLRLNIAIETADALTYLHAIDPPIIHRDVKTTNILLDTSFHVKVADFGLSRLFPTDVTHVSTAPQGTPGYLDPEYHQCYQLTNKSDVYSFGVVLIELISSKPAVDITRPRKEINLSNMAMNRIQNGELDQLVDESLGYQSDQAKRKTMTMVAEVAFRCLQADGDMRPPIKEVLETLKAIQNEECKNIAPSSPNSVINNWVSRSTTPNPSE
ncbi:LEAF RUST 10 DISEASE-RESISTANCE LOCUS RECEPTOR-LIKE PROTEIN KINASE-like [Canna indica]|uniref:non-specific serine/threonine protein kinase n=1 Tax=Canna indica TaxID=4628 RepID=A0AAQ3KZB7_9LILI|nr:LEAF RUST 10 DISEASE-RESISTANCE LOCUS RECEPTOR-LIKE PROTEIN KINASE-like [Canna indica]